MPHDEDVNRRIFLERLAAGALLGAAGAYNRPVLAQSNPGAWAPPPVLKNPNILIIMVDEMRPPMWMNASQSAALSQTVLPNIMGRIQSNSYNFEQFFVSATVCTASRAALLTGLYAPQTAMYVNCDGGTETGAPALNPAFPTWGEALTTLNPAYQGNVWWFGKWHLSQQLIASPLSPYGFNTRTYPGGSAHNPSPDGAANEGTDGGPFKSQVWASDAMIANDFIGWIQGQAPTTGQPSSPWCATVSLINPHDICNAPAWLQSSPFPPTGVPLQPVYFPPQSEALLPSFYTSSPSPWNYENLLQVPNKPSLQYTFFNELNSEFGTVTNWPMFLNQYFWLQNFVDQQVGLVLNALASSPFANNTIILFLSDHGDYAGSHGLHAKGFAVYDESISAPFYVQFPGQAGSISMNQMCCAVDFFGLICDLATGGSGQWRLAYPDLANRQSIWSFLYNNCTETRIAPAPVGIPYVLHTFDAAPGNALSHIVCLRTKLDLSAGVIGAKLAFYYDWATCTTYPNSTAPSPEFYDYNPQTTNNTSEMGNDYYSTNPTTQNTIAQYTPVLGSMTPPSTGLAGSELNRPLIGTGTDGNPLSQAQAAAQQAFFNYFSGAGSCSGA
jgi:arylsulfatase A-like enzyme